MGRGPKVKLTEMHEVTCWPGQLRIALQRFVRSELEEIWKAYLFELQKRKLHTAKLRYWLV